MVSEASTVAVPESVKPSAGYGAIDAVIECAASLCDDVIDKLSIERERALFFTISVNVLGDRSLDESSEMAVGLEKIDSLQDSPAITNVRVARTVTDYFKESRSKLTKMRVFVRRLVKLLAQKIVKESRIVGGEVPIRLG